MKYNIYKITGSIVSFFCKIIDKEAKRVFGLITEVLILD